LSVYLERKSCVVRLSKHIDDQYESMIRKLKKSCFEWTAAQIWQSDGSENATARNVTIAAVDHPQFKLLWVPPAERESVRVAFVQSVKSSPELTITAVIAPSDEQDYVPTAKHPQTLVRSMLWKRKQRHIWL